MAEPSLEGYGDRADLRRALAAGIEAIRSDLRIVAEGFLGEESVMDGLAVGGEGELVSIRFAKPAEDRATLTRALADLTWLRARRRDLLKLAPGLGIDPSAEPRAMVFCRAFSVESRAAVDNLPDGTIELWQCRGLGPVGQRRLLIEPVDSHVTTPARPLRPAAGGTVSACVHPDAPLRGEARVPPDAAGQPASGPSRNGTRPGAPESSERPRADRRLADPPSHSSFRTGLSPADLVPTQAASTAPVRPESPSRRTSAG